MSPTSGSGGTPSPLDDRCSVVVAARRSGARSGTGLRDTDGNKTDEQPYVFVPGEDPVPLANFQPRMETEARLTEEFDGVPPEERTVSIRADSTTPGGVVQELIRMARDVGFVQIALRATVDPDN